VMIQELTGAGFRVVALQRGPYLRARDFVSDDELRTASLFSPEQIETWRPDANSPTQTGRFNFVAHCVGGTMAQWAGLSWRFRSDEFRVLSVEGPMPGASLADWPIDYEELEPYYERAEWEYGVAGDAAANPYGAPRRRGYPNPSVPDRTASLRLARGATRLGYRPFPAPMAINSRPYRGRPACTYGGACSGYGCPIGARGTPLSVSLPKAHKTGLLDLRPNSLAFQIELGRDGRARSVRYLDQERREEREVFARHIIVAGNAIGTPHLLLLSRSASFPDGLANSSGLVGRNLMFHVLVQVSFTIDEPALGFTGLENHRAIDDLHASDPRRGFIRGGVVTEVNFPHKQPLGYALLSHTDYGGGRPSWGGAFKEYLRKFPQVVAAAAVLEDLPMDENRIDLDPDVADAYGLPVPRITHRQHPNDLAMSAWYRARMLELADAADAVETWVPLEVTEEKPTQGGSHIHGTCRMGTDPSRSVVDRWCRSHDVPNLWIVDASVFPTSSGYNPTLTILANAFRVADHFVTEAKKGAL
ncbi:MAG: GMC family oxidoreductase, partial [Gemmatimonadota bacterium]